MMTKNELTNTKAQLDAALKQINNLEVLVNTHLYPIQLDNMVRTFKHVCPVTIKMTKYKDKKENKIDWYSDPFYTHNQGYKMYFCVYPSGDGNGEGTDLSVYLYLMKGPHDDELTWPLRGKFEIKMLNQISDSEHHSVTVTYDDRASNNGVAGRITVGNQSKGWGWAQYISNEDLNKITPTRQYLKDDCLFFQVTKL